MDFLCFLSSKDAGRHQSMAEGRECTKYTRMIGLGLLLLALQCKNFTSLDVSIPSMDVIDGRIRSNL
uniref:Uncharacterized protein n=1 Tax=Setaria viridis TaxID=4556 RepID=A0A4U6UV69_SETVI|nr:hypothetical protein SEVIR_4G035200v2 [Setaria viridis]